MPSPKNSAPQKPALRTSIINPDADRRLGRLTLIFFAIIFALVTAFTMGMPVVNAATHLSIVPKTLLNVFAMLVVLVLFYYGLYKLYQVRLEIGRERVQARAWTEAVAALEPFSVPMQRFLDSSGEAHYLLGQAYAGTGDKVRAEKARAFVRRKSGSPWAEKLLPSKGPGISRTTAKATANAKVYDGPERDGQEKRPAPPKTKPRRRF